jgi:hypothetical protein
MAYEESLRSITMNADASVGIYTGVPGTAGAADPNSGKQYCFVKVTGPHQVGMAVAADANVIGVLQNKPQGVGHAATVGYQGVSKVRVGVAVAAGGDVYADASGFGAATGTNKLGIALMAATAANQVIPVLLRVN